MSAGVCRIFGWAFDDESCVWCDAVVVTTAIDRGRDRPQARRAWLFAVVAAAAARIGERSDWGRSA